jgi:hypothetical protein
MPSGVARVRSTSMVWGSTCSETKNLVAFFFLGLAMKHVHGLGGGSAFVEQAGVGNFEAGQVNYHRLIIDEGFEAALGNFGLVGRVSSVPAGVFKNVALNNGGQLGVVVAQADVVFKILFWPAICLNLARKARSVRAAGRFSGVFEADGRRHGFVDKLIERLHANGAQHLSYSNFVGAVMTVHEHISGLGFQQHKEKIEVAGRCGRASSRTCNKGKAKTSPDDRIIRLRKPVALLGQNN